jgi:uncharacterized protein YbjT (DUF2867 family)
VEAIGRQAERIVYVSSERVEHHSGKPAGKPAGESADSRAAAHAATERLIEHSGLEWTFLRPTGYAAGDLVWARQIRSGDVVRAPFAGLSRPLVHERDVAAAAVHVLLEEGYAGRPRVLTGPRSLAPGERVDAIAEAIGRPLAFEEVSVEADRAAMLADGCRAETVDRLLTVLARLAQDAEGAEPVNKTVEDITGAPARTFREWAADHADAFHSHRA